MKAKLMMCGLVFFGMSTLANAQNPVVVQQPMPLGAQALPGQEASFVPPPPAPARKKITAAPAPGLLDVRSGVNYRIGIAIGHTNRLLMPFKKPVVKTNSTATISVEGNIVYVSTTNEEPITLFIHEVGQGDPAVSLTLVPGEISPISSNVRIIGYEGPQNALESNEDAPKSNEDARQYETTLPYVQTLTAVMKDLALEKVPDGYGLSNIRGYGAGVPRCSMPNLVLEPFQLLTGSELKVYVFRATNTGVSRAEVTEDRCGRVRAVAAWPRRVLEPGQSTEIYVITSREDDVDPSTVRRSVVGG